MENSIVHNGVHYILSSSDDGWIYVSGGDHFRFMKNNLGQWIFSKHVDVDLQVRLKEEVIVHPLF
jgi:hypothetical protein